MKRPGGEKWIFGALVLAVLLLVFSGAGWGQALPAASEKAEAEEEQPPPAVVKPEVEKPPPGAPEKPGAFPPGAAGAAPETTLEVGPATGIAAPYGNPLALDTLGRGWEGHRLAIFRVSPYLEYNALYRTNIFLTATQKQSDFINTIIPGLRIEIPFAGQHRVSLGYLGNYYLFSRHDDQSHYDHSVNADVLFNFPGGLSCRFGNTLRAATEEQTALTGRQRDYTRNTPYLLAEYKLSDRWKLQGTYQVDILDFRLPVDRFDAFREHLGGLALYYRFWPKTAALVQYLFTRREYPNSPQADNNAHSPFVGLTWDPTAKLTGTVKFGYTFKNYDEEIPGRKKSPKSWSLSIQTLYRYSRYTQISLVAQRSIQEDLDFGNNAYENTAVYLAYFHEWHYFRATTYAAVSYSKNHYLNPATVAGMEIIRDDKIVTFGAGLIRPFTRWLRLRLDYNYANRGTNAANLPYNEHRVLAGIQASF